MTGLGVGVDGIEVCSRDGVPEADGAVCRAAPGGQQVALEGAPRQGFHCRLVGSQPACTSFLDTPLYALLIHRGGGHTVSEKKVKEAALNGVFQISQ